MKPTARSPRTFPATAILLLLTLGLADGLRAERVILKDGLVLEGEVVDDDNRIVVRTGPRVRYVGVHRLLEIVPGQIDPQEERFAIEQPTGRRADSVAAILGILELEPWDDFGRRAVTLRGADGPVRVYQAVTEIHPHYVATDGTNRSWPIRMALEEVPDAVIGRLIERSLDPNDPNDQVRAVAFWVQAERFRQALTVAATLKEQHPEVADRLLPLEEAARKGATQVALIAVERALTAGDLPQAHASIRKLADPDATIPPEFEADVRTLKRRIDVTAAEIQKARRLLGDAIAAADSMPEHRKLIRAAVDEVILGVSLPTLDRLRPLLDIGDQPGTPDASRLALGLSGWCLGADLAQTDLEEAAKLWQRRDQLRNLLFETDIADVESRLRELVTAGDARVDAELLPNLPAPASGIRPGEDGTVRFPEPFTRKELVYHVHLPTGYRRFSRHPAIVTLHGADTTAEQQLRFWSALADEFGYIVLAPEHRPRPGEGYQYSQEEHDILAAFLADARTRFAVDADRLFLSGHELGGFAAWDYAAAHPSEFAGLITFTAAPIFYAEKYLDNYRYLPVLMIEGTANGGNAVQNRSMFQRFVGRGFDAIYVEYPGRGREMYPTELPFAFEWMNRKRRVPPPREFSAITARYSDRRFYWVEADQQLATSVVPPRLFAETPFKPATIEAQVNDASLVSVRTSGLDRCLVLFPVGLAQLDAPDFQVRINGKPVHRGPLEPNLDFMLRRVRETGDRYRPYLAVVKGGR